MYLAMLRTANWGHLTLDFTEGANNASQVQVY